MFSLHYPDSFSGQRIVELIFQDKNFRHVYQCYTQSDTHFSQFEINLLAQTVLIPYLSVYPICDVRIEYFLIELRSWCLKSFVLKEYDCNNKAVLSILSALARQCYLTGYLYPVSQQELEWLIRLNSHFDKKTPALETAALLYACFKSLGHLEPNKKKCLQHSAVTPYLKGVIEQHIVNPTIEMNLKQTFLKTTICESQVGKMHEQYESYPYPVYESSSNYALHYHDEYVGHLKKSPCAILIAGCGTGLSAILNAKYFNNAKIDAFDLSLTSLAKAKRISQQESIKNINFFQQDLLQLNTSKQYHFIECIGVLQHLQQPAQAIHILSKVVRPKGYLRLSFYSHQGRQWVKEARHHVMNTDEVIPGREKLKSLETAHAFKKITRINDFYSRAEYIDMLYHAYEQAVDISFIEEQVKSNHFTFLGFEIGDILHQHTLERTVTKNTVKNSFSYWKEYEQHYPELFITQYTVWLQKK